MPEVGPNFPPARGENARRRAARWQQRLRRGDGGGHRGRLRVRCRPGSQPQVKCVLQDAS